MQTFAPFSASFEDSLRCLDDVRLGKQRVEAYQILRSVLGIETANAGWANHPARLAWVSNTAAIADYTVTACFLYVARGNKDTIMDKAVEVYRDVTGTSPPLERDTRYNSTRLYRNYEPTMPWWWGNEDYHFRHRVALYVKDPNHYGSLIDVTSWPKHPPEVYQYLWPCEHRKYYLGNVSGRYPFKSGNTSRNHVHYTKTKKIVQRRLA